MSRAWSLARAYAVDALIVLVAVASALEVALRHDPVREPRSAPLFAVPAIALVVLPLLGRRRFRFAAPASLWLLAAAVSFADGRLIPFTGSAVVAGFAAAFLLGGLRDSVQSRIGLAIVVAAAAIVVYNDPRSAAGDLVFTPLLFAIGWLAGFALRERAQQAEAAELRARLAEREREAAARIAVAEERGRIARRIVEAGDAERRRLERDLHDGAQSRLVALALKLRMARTKAQDRPEVAVLLDESIAELRESLDELRELARGIHPAVLTDRGLAPALEALAGRSPVPVEVDVAPPDACPTPRRRPSTSSFRRRSRTSLNTRARSMRRSPCGAPGTAWWSRSPTTAWAVRTWRPALACAACRTGSPRSTDAWSCAARPAGAPGSVRRSRWRDARARRPGTR